MQIRTAGGGDYDRVIVLLEEWMGGHYVVEMLPRLFFVHFAPTTFVAEEDGELVGFLTGFLSQTAPEEAYVHIVGVDPDYRHAGVARALYERFFEVCREHGRSVVRAVTSPRNRGSLLFHARLGFELEPSDVEVEEIPVHGDYDGPGRDRVVFRRRL